MKRLLAVLIALLALSGCSLSDKNGKDAALTSFSYSHSGMSTDEIYTYSVRMEEGRYLADFDLYCRFELCDVPMDNAEVQALEKLIKDSGLWAWNGFSESDAYVLDGESFGLSAAFADGRTLEACGNNAFPAGYREGAAAICNFFENFMDRHGINLWEE